MKRKSLDSSYDSNKPRLRPFIPSSENTYACPYVEIEGVKFYSDRFYLNAPTGLPYYNHDEDYDKMCTEHKARKSHAKKEVPPAPLFDRARFIQGLDLEAAIVGTYTIDIDWMSKEIPALFPPVESDIGGIKCTKIENERLKQEGEDFETMSHKNNIPTLLLHGHQGLKNDLLRKRKEQEQKVKNRNSSRKHYQESKQFQTVNTKNCDFINTEGKEHVITLKDDSDVKTEIVKESTPPSEGKDNDKKRISRKRKISKMQQIAKRLGKKVFIEPNFNEPVKKKTKKSIVNVVKSEDCETIHNFHTKKTFSLIKETEEDKKWKDELKMFGPSVYVTQVLPQWIPPKAATSIEKQQDKNKSEREPKLKRCMGTYHPKFMLLFEKSGSLVVSVSTANLTRQRGVDGTWLQRFHPAKKNSGKNEKAMKGNCDGSDFGHVLCDFLQRQADAAECNTMVPTEFLRRYLGIFSLNDFLQRYEFDNASVHLVSTVPGSHPGRFGAQHLSRLSGVQRGRYNRRILYGPQRINDIMHKCTNRMNPWLPSKYLSNSDKLIAQTTSFGSKWTRKHLEQLVQQYMGVDDRKKSSREVDFLQNIDIVWPTKRHMDQIKQGIEDKFEDHGHQKISFDHFTFLSSEAFNLIDQSTISRMTKYKNLQPSLLPHVVSPHIKSYGRIINKKNVSDSSDKQQTCLAWFMLTSACLSRGAQGYAERENIFQGTDEKNYLNFELGVLFCSRLQGNPLTDRLYKSYSVQSSLCDSDNYNSIYLPIPFQMKSKSYQPFEDIPDFDDDPFFHEVTKKSIVEGNMGLTPLGKKFIKEHLQA